LPQYTSNETNKYTVFSRYFLWKTAKKNVEKPPKEGYI